MNEHPTGPTRHGAAAALLLLAALAITASGCIRHQVDPVRIEPVHITVDVNLRVDRQLDDFFDFQDEIEAELDD